jgi:oxygen-independent coproporphyrinogen-3 oxidase
VLPAEALDALLETMQGVAGVTTGTDTIEFTVEANPSSTDELKLELLRHRGVNRISFGAQSFNPDELRVLERIHDPQHIVESVRAARAAGFDNINLDLIYGIPGQTLDRWRETLYQAINLGTDHLSCYALMYEPGTSLTRLRREGRLLACDEGIEAEMFELTIDLLATAGFEHYEISNFARPGRRCRANIIYWENREYLGVGPSAVSYLDGVRRKNVADVRKYVEAWQGGYGEVVVDEERLSPQARASETAIQMLRLTEGISFERFAAITGFEATQLFAEQFAHFESISLASRTATHFALTRKGLLLSNRIMEEFLIQPAGV